MSENATKKRPLFEAFKVNGEGQGAEWIKVGAVWENAKGAAFVIPEGISLSGRVVLMPPREAPAPEEPHT